MLDFQQPTCVVLILKNRPVLAKFVVMGKNQLTCLVSVFYWHTQVQEDDIIESIIALGIRDLILHDHVESLLPITCLMYLLNEMQRS